MRNIVHSIVRMQATAIQTKTLAPIALLCLSALFLLACMGHQEVAQTNTATPVTPAVTPSPKIEARATIASSTFQLEVADTSEERARGLMGRESLEEDRGIIFVFQSQQTLSFWMKNTLIPLDILFIEENLTVVDVQTMRPERESSGGSLPIHTSAAPALYAIEINEGVAAECGIAPGAPVVLREITPEAAQ